MRMLLNVCVVACAAVLPMVGGCSHEVAHTETEHQTMTGGTEKTDTTVTKHSDGTVTVDKDKSYSNP